MTTTTSLVDLLKEFKSIEPEVWDYREDLQNVTEVVIEDDAPESGPALADILDVLGVDRTVDVQAWLHGLVTDSCPVGINRDLDLQLRTQTLDRFAALPGRYRIALLLKDGRGSTVGETAALMGISPAAARSVLYRARRRFRIVPDR